MVEETTQEWFLEIEGQRTGPFNTEQILGLLEDGELPDTAQIFSSTTAVEFITVRQLAERESASKPSIAVTLTDGPSKLFTPPPRPADLQPGNESARSSPA